MADDAVFAGPKGKGPPTWLIIGGVGVGVLALVMVVSKGGSGGTTAAGASINAGLGSIQEAQQNLLGTVQSGQLQNNANFASLGGQLTDTQTTILKAITDQGTTTGSQIQNAIDSINQNTNSQSSGILSSIADALSKVLTGQGAITNVINSESQVVQAGFGTTNSNIAATQQSIIAGFSDVQSRENAMMAAIQPALDQMIQLQQQLSGQQQALLTQSGAQAAATQASIASLQTQITNIGNGISSQISQSNHDISDKINSIGTFLGWQWYQLPNRYTPYLPGATAQNPYGDLNVATLFPNS
jgi:hypothetical protein